MEEDNMIFEDFPAFFVPSRFAWMLVKQQFQASEHECIICDKNDRFLSRKEDFNFA